MRGKNLTPTDERRAKLRAPGSASPLVPGRESSSDRVRGPAFLEEGGRRLL